MINQEEIQDAIKWIEGLRDRWNDKYNVKYCNMAIKSLESKDVLDKIRAEIDDEADYAYASFNLYKEDILHAESDELPDDDFRYGLRRAIEIIDKYMAESEGNTDECNL